MADDSAHRERILAHAEQIFMREGFAGVTVDDLTEGLGMSKKTFYRAFRSKEDLIEQLVFGILTAIRGQVETIARGPGSFIEKIDAMGGVFASISRRIESPMILDLQRHLPAVWGKVDGFRREGIRENFSLLIEQGIREGVIRRTTNVRLLVLSLVGAIQTVLKPTVLADEAFSADQAAGGILQMLFLGVATEQGRNALHAVRKTNSQQLP